MTEAEAIQNILESQRGTIKAVEILKEVISKLEKRVVKIELEKL